LSIPDNHTHTHTSANNNDYYHYLIPTTTTSSTTTTTTLTTVLQYKVTHLSNQQHCSSPFFAVFCLLYCRVQYMPGTN